MVCTVRHLSTTETGRLWIHCHVWQLILLSGTLQKCVILGWQRMLLFDLATLVVGLTNRTMWPRLLTFGNNCLTDLSIHSLPVLVVFFYRLPLTLLKILSPYKTTFILNKIRILGWAPKILTLPWISYNQYNSKVIIINNTCSPVTVKTWNYTPR